MAEIAMITTMSDQDLIITFNTGNQICFDVLFRRYLPLVHKLHRQYYFKRLDRDDWEQEARIVMLKLVRRYDLQNGATFGSFFKVCLRNRAFDILRSEKRREVDNNAVYENKLNEQAVDYHRPAPDEYAICQQVINEFLENCSSFERKAFHLLLQGKAKHEIKRILQCSERSVDGAISRCRKKLKLILQ